MRHAVMNLHGQTRITRKRIAKLSRCALQTTIHALLDSWLGIGPHSPPLPRYRLLCRESMVARLEVACFNPESGILAAEAGASRIELCANYGVGGITPPQAWLTELKSAVQIPVYAMIRPRGGDFEYSETEFESMKRCIDQMKDIADGFVFGILEGNHVDIRRTTELVQRAHPLPCTFHRAFDEARNAEKALEDVITTGCCAILTSGGAMSAIEGTKALGALVKSAAQRIIIMPGGGVRVGHLAQLRQETAATVFHSSAMVGGATLPDEREIRQIVELLTDTGSACCENRRLPL